jgi:DNA-binding beta-propeller fold protein YncE
MMVTAALLPAVLALVGCQAAPGAPQNQEASAGAEPAYAVEEGWAKLPAGRTWGSTSAVFPATDGAHLWVGERCGENICTGHDDVDPVLLFDASGNVVRSFGKGMIVWPHGIFVDGENNVWIADARGAVGQGAEAKGHQVLKFSPEGELLMALGRAGVAGSGRDAFDQPSDVLVAPDGSIFVADGHGAGGSNRIVKFAADGTYLLEWGTTGGENGEFRDPHALAMDSQGRLFVGDRANSRIQLFDQEGNHLATWTQFGRPSGIFIDADDVMYVADSESNTARNPGWKRGIRIGSARDGWVTAFIPDPEADPDNSGTSGAEGVAADARGNVYGAEVGPRRLTKYVQR